jgi:hypothetical protein
MHTLPNLSPAIVRELFASLREALPEPADASPETRAAREDLAMAAVAALHPADAIEGELAVQIVLAAACAKDSLRLAKEYRNDLAATVRCRAQAATMMRQMHSGLSRLERRQAAREKAETQMHPAAMERAGWWFRDATAPEPTPSPAQPDTPEPAAPADSCAPPDEFGALTEAEQYAVLYPDRAARIRASRGLPERLDFGPPEPAIVEAVAHGTSPILEALDTPPIAAAAE